MQKEKSYTLLEIRDKLANYCAYQDRCHQEVEKKLKSYNLIPEAEDDIMVYLLRENFLNEERFAHSFARGKFYQKNWGRIKIKNELRRRSINQRLITSALEEIDEQDYLATIEKLLLKKDAVIVESNSYKRKQKLIRFLLQKGYEYQLIISVWQNIFLGE